MDHHEHDFGQDYWDEHWRTAAGTTAQDDAHPYLAIETADLVPGTALEAGCGEGAEAVWLARHGWTVTGVDLSERALAGARSRAAAVGATLTWEAADLTGWTPPAPYDLVSTHYAHPSEPQLAFYGRLAGWVAPGGTLLVVGHRHNGEHGHGHGHGHGDGEPPAEASATAASIVALLEQSAWEVVTAAEPDRTRSGRTLRDVVVRATRRTT